MIEIRPFEPARDVGALARLIAEHDIHYRLHPLEWTTSQENAAARALYDALGAEPMPWKINYRFEGEALARMAGRRRPQ